MSENVNLVALYVDAFHFYFWLQLTDFPMRHFAIDPSGSSYSVLSLPSPDRLPGHWTPPSPPASSLPFLPSPFFSASFLSLPILLMPWDVYIIKYVSLPGMSGGGGFFPFPPPAQCTSYGDSEPGCVLCRCVHKEQYTQIHTHTHTHTQRRWQLLSRLSMKWSSPFLSSSFSLPPLFRKWQLAHPPPRVVKVGCIKKLFAFLSYISLPHYSSWIS